MRSRTLHPARVGMEEMWEGCPEEALRVDVSATEEASSPSKAEEAASKAEEELPAAVVLQRKLTS